MVFLPMSAKMGVFGADLWIFLADRTIEFTDNLEMFYYRGFRECPRVKGFLLDPCLSAKDNFKAFLDYFQVKYQK